MKTKLIVFGIVAVILGGLGYHAQNLTPTKQAQIPEIKQAQSQTFEIKELGVKFALPEDIQDLTYSIKTLGGGLGTAAFFSTKSLTQIGGKYCTSSEGPLGTIRVADTTKTAGHEDELRLGPPAKTIGITGVYYTHPQATCADTQASIDLTTKQIASLQEALKTTGLISN
ncbi:MAG: hypothetical protein JWN89_149 [Parcubacteria group bacterium]|nr:hypothetical protein [Parcubacteria group bacterium]